VFAHRRLDPGARQLLAAAEVAPGMRVLDIGCGAGTVALGLASRAPAATVLAIDSNARAIECTRAGTALNGLGNVAAELNSDGRLAEESVFDLAVANPPYYADFRIAAHFLGVAARALRPGGQVMVVAKRPQWYAEQMPAAWREVAHRASGRYHLITARRP
jgi:16S rRNA (guanine1207-N2)-methyltransferase